MLVTLELWDVTRVWLYPSKAVLQWLIKFLKHLVGVTILDNIFKKFCHRPFSHPTTKKKKEGGGKATHWGTKKKKKQQKTKTQKKTRSLPEIFLSFFSII